MCNFEIGQKVVCIKSYSIKWRTLGVYAPQEGEIFEIREIYRGDSLRFVGIINDTITICHTVYTGYRPDYFCLLSDFFNKRSEEDLSRISEEITTIEIAEEILSL